MTLRTIAAIYAEAKKSFAARVRLKQAKLDLAQFSIIYIETKRQKRAARRILKKIEK